MLSMRSIYRFNTFTTGKSYVHLIELCMLKCSKFQFDIDIEIKVTPIEIFQSNADWLPLFTLSVRLKLCPIYYLNRHYTDILYRSMWCVIEWVNMSTYMICGCVNKSVISLLSCLGIVYKYLSDYVSLVSADIVAIPIMIATLIAIAHRHGCTPARLNAS